MNYFVLYFILRICGSSLLLVFDNRIISRSGLHDNRKWTFSWLLIYIDRLTPCGGLSIFTLEYTISDKTWLALDSKSILVCVCRYIHIHEYVYEYVNYNSSLFKTSTPHLYGMKSKHIAFVTMMWIKTLAKRNWSNKRFS